LGKGQDGIEINNTTEEKEGGEKKKLRKLKKM